MQTIMGTTDTLSSKAKTATYLPRRHGLRHAITEAPPSPFSEVATRICRQHCRPTSISSRRRQSEQPACAPCARRRASRALYIARHRQRECATDTARSICRQLLKILSLPASALNIQTAPPPRLPMFMKDMSSFSTRPFTTVSAGTQVQAKCKSACLF